MRSLVNISSRAFHRFRYKNGTTDLSASWVYAIISLYPLLWMIFYSFKSNEEIFVTNPFGFPLKWQLSNYVNAWTQYDVPLYFRNSVIVGIAAKRKKLDTLLDTLTTSAIVAGTVTVAAFPINLLLNGGSTGNQWGDAVMGFLGESGFPKWGGLLIGDLYVELLDKLVILVTMYLIQKLIRFSGKMIRERKKQPGETAAETAARTGALMLAVMLGASVCLGGTVSGRADAHGGTV